MAPDLKIIAKKTRQWSYLVEAHRAALERVLSLAEQHPDNIGLRMSSESATLWLGMLTDEAAHPSLGAGPFGSLGRWGQNGFGPAIADMVRGAEWHAAQDGRAAA